MSPRVRTQRTSVLFGAVTTALVAASSLVPPVRDALDPVWASSLGRGLAVATALFAGVIVALVAGVGRTAGAGDLAIDDPPGPDEAASTAGEPSPALSGSGRWHGGPLGDLPSRGELPGALDTMAAGLAPESGRIAYVVIDILDLDKLNRMFNHDIGDGALDVVIARLHEVCRGDDRLFHYSGDEFVMLRPGITDVAEVDELAVELLGVLGEDLDIENYAIKLRANLGVAMVGSDGVAVAEARQAAESALYRSTLQGPNRYEIFSHSAHREVSPGFLAEWLHESIVERRFGLHYQRIEDLSTREIVGVEALLRWEHPERGGLEPRDLLPALRDTGLIVELGEHLVDEACRQIAVWSDEVGEEQVPLVFVNIDPLQIAHGGFLPAVEASLARHHVSADRLCFELGQLSNLPRLSTAWGVLREAKALGITLALDNFGGPDTNLAVLRSVQLSYVKLDRAVVSARNATAVDDAFGHGLVSLSNELGFTVVAEGVEDPASVDRARRMGCRLGQGFQLGAPVPGNEIGAVIADRAASRSAV